ncbi:MAG: hypothetical protein IPG90_00765 [Bacteroidetes bacterium]|nr:hypothetical protein [Bacteroidota bacterium]MBK9523629.1 hypothetical protein [Bacteroidota bacterium]MBK9541375.1 hypothetical protein [Bacteroidota bacterium]MBL0258746.1 hypothetical protein [Bacteroidota bacterium]MBP6401360.1 hypothetical protein [Bacteroidia bacterium]
MKTRLLTILMLITAGIFILNACKKNEEEDKVQLDANVSQFNTDANNYKSESDQADNDINNSLSSIPAFGRVAQGTEILSSPLCGVIIDSSQIANKILFYNFDGQTPCFSPSRTRSGQIKVELTTGAHWSDANSVLTITYINFKVTRLYDNKSITFNGVKTLKNINGNDWLGFILSSTTLKYQERALNIAVTFDNNLSATWNSARTTEWNYVQATTNPSIHYAHIVFTARGDTSLNGHTTVDSWGINRFGENFTTYYNSAIVSNTYCGLWRFNSGELVHHLNNADFKLTLGVDQNGNATPYACAYGYKVAWSANGNSNSVILSY